MKNPNAVALGSMKSEKKARSSKENGKQGGYWKQKRNLTKPLSTVAVKEAI